MSQIENHWDEVTQIELEMKRHMIALGIDWHNDLEMKKLSDECKSFGPTQVKAAYASQDRTQKTRAELFALASLMLRTMENAAGDDRDVHAGEVWKAFGKHLYDDYPERKA
jgi:hypothetical protein